MLGIPLKEIRETAGIGQRRLGEGLCDRGVIRTYEEGRGEPEKLFADALVQRAGKTMNSYDILLDGKEYELVRQRTWIQFCLSRGKLHAAERAIQDYRVMPGTDDKLQRQFLAFVNEKLIRRQGASLRSRMEVVCSGMSETFDMKTLSPGVLEKRVFHLLELFLLQQYAVLLEEAGRETEAVCWYEAFARRFGREGQESVDQHKLYPLIAYRMARYYGKIGKFQEALPCIKKALELLRCPKLFNGLYAMLKEMEIKFREKLGEPVAKEEKDVFLQLKKFLWENGEIRKENYDPVYQESHCYSVNAMMLERRRLQKRTREGLVGNVCDPRTLERQEKTGSKLHKRIRKGLFEELGLSYLKYDRGIESGDYGDSLIYEQMLQAFDNGGQERAWYLYRKLADKLDMDKLVNRQFEKYWGTELRFQSGRIGRGERDQNLWEMLGWTMPEEGEEQFFSCWLTKYERQALISLAWDCEGGEIQRLLPLLKRQLHRNFNPVGQRIVAEYYDKLLYCIARGYLKIGDSVRAGQYVTLAVRQGAFGERGLSWGWIFSGRFPADERFLHLVPFCRGIGEGNVV